MAVATASPVSKAMEAQIEAEVKKRSELNESPATRIKFKDFYRQFRIKEKESFDSAKAFGLRCKDLLPEKVHLSHSPFSYNLLYSLATSSLKPLLFSYNLFFLV